MKRLAQMLAACLLAGSAAAAEVSVTATAPNGVVDRIPATLLKPAGDGPFPAVVIMHDCSGLGARSSGAPARWADELLKRGYVVIFADSFGTRGFRDGVCRDASPGRTDVGPPRRAHDAYGALAHLRSLPYVDGRRVGVMGGSHGGSTTLAAMARPATGFAAAVALYPACAPWLRNAAGYKPDAPLLILIGEKDDWTPAEPCRRLAESAQKAGHPVAIKVYPGAHHSFDSSNPVRYVAERINMNSPTRRGATTGGDPAAWADSIREVAAFFGTQLAKKD